MSRRFTQDHTDAWKRDGAVLIPSFFTPEEIAPVVKDFEHLYGAGRGCEDAADDGSGFSLDQFKNNAGMPFDCSQAPI